MTDKLSLYKGAARVLGTHTVASLTENVPLRRDLDGAWSDGAIRTCLSLGLWNFAMRAAQVDYSPSSGPAFGYQRAFDKPSDWVRTAVVAEDAYFDVRLLRYADEAGFWYADLDTIYTKFVSDGLDYGLDYSKWPQNFVRLFEHHFALQVVDRVTKSKTKKEDIEKDLAIWLRRAKTTDAMDEAPVRTPPGSWTAARSGWRGGDKAKGNLIG